MKSTGLSLVVLLLVLIISYVSARPTKTQSLSRQKRQSDQRLAELETLLALQKYGRHRFRMDRKKGSDAEHPPGYGMIDFRMLGRKKKSTRFSPGESASSAETDLTLQDLPESYHPEQPRNQPNRPSYNQRREAVVPISSEEDGSIYPDADHHDRHHPNVPNSDRDSTSLLHDADADPFLYIEKK